MVVSKKVDGMPGRSTALFTYLLIMFCLVLKKKCTMKRIEMPDL